MIILGIGSNLSSKLGNRFKNIELALTYLEKKKIKVLKKSSFYETPSYPDKKYPKFINIVATVKTDLKPLDLMLILFSIEKKLGRMRTKKNEPRTCDIDIVDFNKEIINFTYKNINFSSPHKSLSNRSFVLYPLREILPMWTHPSTNETVSALISKLSNEDKKSILKIKNLV